MSRRDLRLDLLRGLCLLKMVFNHLWHTPLHIVQGWMGYVTAAEAFFFISGAVVGIVHGRRARELGLRRASAMVLTRALQLYLANLAFVFLFVSLEAAGWLGRDWFVWLWADGFQWALLFDFDQPYYLDVLTRYVAFLALTPLALWCLARGRSLWLALASFGIWGANLLLEQRLRVPLLERASDFPLVAWQLLFFVGMLLGYHRRRLAAWWRRRRGGSWLPGMAAATLFFVLLKQGHESGWIALPDPWMHLAFDREHLGPLRLINLCVAFALLFEVTDRFWRPLAAFAGELLLPLGQSSLYVFLMHIPLVWWSREVVRGLALPPVGGIWWFLAADLALIASLWWMTRRQVLFGWIPR